MYFNLKLRCVKQYICFVTIKENLHYEHTEIGYNFRLTNIQAALGVAQLEKLPEFLERKQEILNKYQTAITDVDGLTIADVPDYAENNHWMILLQIDKKIYGEDREKLMHRLDLNNVQTRPAWAPIHMQKSYRNCQTYRIDRAEELVLISLCLPSSTNLSDKDLNKVIAHLNG